MNIRLVLIVSILFLTENVMGWLPYPYPIRRDEPSSVPTGTPTNVPTEVPTAVPTTDVQDIPTRAPTSVPTSVPTNTPTVIPSTQPTPCPVKPLPTICPSDDKHDKHGITPKPYDKKKKKKKYLHSSHIRHNY